MSSQRITVRVSESLRKRLKQRASLMRRSESAVACDALENFLRETPRSFSAYDLAKTAGLIGCVLRAPFDLSTNRQHF